MEFFFSFFFFMMGDVGLLGFEGNSVLLVASPPGIEGEKEFESDTHIPMYLEVDVKRRRESGEKEWNGAWI